MISVGFLHTATIPELAAVMRGLGYVEFARYRLDALLTTFWFVSRLEPNPPSVDSGSAASLEPEALAA